MRRPANIRRRSPSVPPRRSELVGSKFPQTNETKKGLSLVMTKFSRLAVLSALAPFLFFLPSAAGAAGPLFERPLHVTRSIDEPLTGTTATLQEYYFGSRAVTVRGERTVIVDYDKREITEIDRANGTYSVTRFEQVAAARGERVAVAKKTAEGAKPAIVRAGSDRRAGRDVEVFAADDSATALHAEIAVDHSVELSKDAFDVIVGAAYPNDGGPSADLARGAAKRAAPNTYGLPIEQTLRWTSAGESLTITNRIVSVDAQTAPPELIAIPPGARLVDSRLLRTRKLADEIESLPHNSRH